MGVCFILFQSWFYTRCRVVLEVRDRTWVRRVVEGVIDYKYSDMMNGG